MQSYAESLLDIIIAEQDALKGLVPICEDCRRVRTKNGTWISLEVFMQNHASASLTESICGVCMYKRYPSFRENIRYFERMYHPE
jgi:hypothetical protein